MVAYYDLMYMRAMGYPLLFEDEHSTEISDTYANIPFLHSTYHPPQAGSMSASNCSESLKYIYRMFENSGTKYIHIKCEFPRRGDNRQLHYVVLYVVTSVSKE
jgi:hypothetical protein